MTPPTFSPSLQPFAPELQLGHLLCVLVDTDRDPNLVAYSTGRETPIPACIVRAGTDEHKLSSVRRIFP